MTITAAVVVFCRKKNTVFALQKCEQEDDEEEDYEMDDLHTDYSTDSDDVRRHRCEIVVLIILQSH